MSSVDTQLVTRAELAEHLRSLLQECSGTPTEAQVQAYECLSRYDAERPQ